MIEIVVKQYWFSSLDTGYQNILVVSCPEGSGGQRGLGGSGSPGGLGGPGSPGSPGGPGSPGDAEGPGGPGGLGGPGYIKIFWKF